MSQQPHILHMHSHCHLDMSTFLLFPFYHIALLPAPLPVQFPSDFLQVKIPEMFAVTLFIQAHLSWNHLPHCAHKAELAFSPKLQTPHGSILPLDKPSFLISPLTTIFYFPKLTFNPLLSDASFHFMSIFLRPSIALLVKNKLSAYSNSLNVLSLANSVIASTTTAKRKVTAQILRFQIQISSLSMISAPFVLKVKFIILV